MILSELPYILNFDGILINFNPCMFGTVIIEIELNFISVTAYLYTFALSYFLTRLNTFLTRVFESTS